MDLGVAGSSPVSHPFFLRMVAAVSAATSPGISAVVPETPISAASLDGASATTVPAVPAPGLPAPTDGGGCPPPLDWKQVVQEFIDQGDAWYLDRPGGYRLQGRTWGQGRPLYFLNGINGTHELFALLVYLLRNDYRCVLFDYPGTRGPARESRGLTLDRLTDDLFAIADQIGDGQFDIFATSFGTLVSLGAMLRQPQRIRKAILQGGFAARKLSLAERAMIRVWSHLPGRFKHVPLRRMVQTANHRRWFPPIDLTRWEFLMENSGITPAASVARRAAVIRDNSLVERLSEITTPTLLIRCEGEGIVPEECHAVMTKGLPHAKSEFMLTSGHLPYLTHPHRIAKLVRAFLEDPAS